MQIIKPDINIDFIGKRYYRVCVVRYPYNNRIGRACNERRAQLWG